MSENSVTLVGRLTQDPEMQFLNSGSAKVHFGLAVEKRWLNRQTQEWDKKVSFFSVVVWDKFAENVANTLKKGYRVIVTGILEQRSWETDNGEKRHVVEITADAIGPDLRFVTAELHGTERAESGSRPAPASGSAPDFDDDPF